MTADTESAGESARGSDRLALLAGVPASHG